MKNLVKYLSVLGLVILGFLCIMIPSTMKAHAYGENGEMARVYISNGSYTHNGGTINKSGVSGVFLSGGTFNFNGGTITGGDGMISGGGIHMTSGTVNMKGGKITNCMAYYGGGVYMSGGTFNMSSGEIIDNTGYSAHAVDIAGGTFNFSGGKIADNYYGGSTNVQGIRVRSGATFNMSGGTISGHGSSSSDTSNYGVYINEGATFIYNGGTINDIIYLLNYSSDAYITMKKAPTSTFNITMYSAKLGTKIAKLDGITTLDLSKINVTNLPADLRVDIQTINGTKYIVLVSNTLTISFETPAAGGSFSSSSISVPYNTNVMISGGDNILVFSQTTSSGESISHHVTYQLPANTAQYAYSISYFEIVNGERLSTLIFTKLTSDVTIRVVLNSQVRSYNLKIKIDGVGSLTSNNATSSDTYSEINRTVSYGTNIVKYILDNQIIFSNGSSGEVVTATANSYRVFSGWFLEGGTQITSYMVTGDTTIIAKIIWDTVPVTLKATNGRIRLEDGSLVTQGTIYVPYFGNISVYAPNYVLAYQTAEGNTAYVSATPDANYSFQDWYVEGQGVLTSYDIGIEYSVTITARFVRKSGFLIDNSTDFICSYGVNVASYFKQRQLVDYLIFSKVDYSIRRKYNG